MDIQDDNHKKFLKLALTLAENNVTKNQGGPFGAVIVKDGEVIATGTNNVTSNNDPTAHAEIEAIRNACKILADFNLSGCELYASSEPCPMCLAAIYWARISKIYYVNSQEMAARHGFDDKLLYMELAKETGERLLVSKEISIQNADKAFKMWENSTDKIPY